jgi:hypothetical protein
MKTTSKFLVAIAAALAIAGCATKGKVPEGGSYVKRTLPDKTVVEEYRTSYAIQAEDMKDARSSVKPIFELEAIDGQTITLSGVKRMAVYAPSSAGQGQQTPRRAAARARRLGEGAHGRPTSTSSAACRRHGPRLQQAGRDRADPGEQGRHARRAIVARAARR